MAKQIIIGVETGTYKDKETGEQGTQVTLYTAKRNMRCAGYAMEKLWFGSTKNNGYDRVASFCNGDFTDLVNRYVEISRGERGYLEDISFLEKCDDAVLIEV